MGVGVVRRGGSVSVPLQRLFRYEWMDVIRHPSALYGAVDALSCSFGVLLGVATRWQSLNRGADNATCKTVLWCSSSRLIYHARCRRSNYQLTSQQRGHVLALKQRKLSGPE